jgi:type II secretory pathway component PulF
LARAAERIVSGMPTAEALAAETEIDGLITLTIRHSPEDELASELGRLGELYEHRAGLAVKAATVAWGFLAMLFVIVAVGTVVIAMFQPLIRIVSYVGF